MAKLKSAYTRRATSGVFACFALAATAFGQAAPAPTADSGHWSILEQYCYDCHNATDWAGGVAFDTMSAADVPHDTKLWEEAVRKLRGHLMPPPGSKQPSQVQTDQFVGWLETSLDARKATPRAGHVTAQRLNRTEYANAVRSLLGVEIKVNDLLPPEIEMDGFDNIAAALTVSPSFLDQYISAARFIAKRAMGSATPKMGKTTYLPAMGDTNGLPLGSSGGMKFTHFFPADGEYHVSLLDDLTGGLYTNPALFRRTIVLFVDGREVFHGDIGGKDDLGVADKEAAPGRAKINARFQNLPIRVTSGTHEIIVTSVERSHALSDENIGGAGSAGFGAAGGGGLRISAGVEVSGPYGATTIGRSPSRDKILVCHPDKPADERPCAEQIVRHLATHAYRRPVNDTDVAKLMAFYDSGYKDIGNFEGGVQEVVMGVLSSPDFLYRIIQPQGDGKHVQLLTPLELASRLSFFLWSDLPDDELLQLAESGKLADPKVYEQQVSRMLADDRAAALVTGFAMRWLNVDDLKAIEPDPTLFPPSKFNEGLRQDFSTEIRLFLSEVLLQNKSVLELLSADYSYVNERLAEHYGMHDVLGSQFRRVTLPDPNRRGLLGKAAILLRTSYGNRTSPVLRGAWVMEKLLGTAPTPPPPGVSTNLDPKDGAAPTTLRARLELHRTNKTCNQCHGVIDPIGLSMENFDVTGAWRTRDTGLPVDASSVLPGGVKVDNVSGLRAALLARPNQFVQAMTEKLMMYATGRAVEASDMPQVRQIVRDAAGDNYRFFDIVMSIAKSDAFRMQGPPEDTVHGDKPQLTAAR